MRFLAILLVAVASCAVGTGNSQMNTSSIAVHLDLRPSQDGNVIAKLEFRNLAESPVALLSWVTFPDGEIDDDSFEVSVNGVKARYVGILIKRPPPDEEDYLSLGPGKTLTSIVNLNSGYKIDGTGEIRARYRAFNYQLVTDAGEGQLESNEALLDNSHLMQR
jgi:hypothetical protein